jgi:hypothetical protein
MSADRILDAVHQRVAAHYRRLSLRVRRLVDDANHLVFIDQPDVVSVLLHNFLGAKSDGASGVNHQRAGAPWRCESNHQVSQRLSHMKHT